MKYDLSSDLHVDINRDRLPAIDWKLLKNDGSDLLIIAGDTANSRRHVRRVLKETAEAYNNVIFIDGNHEHYHHRDTNMNVSSTMGYFKGLSSHNIHYLCGGENSVLIDNVLFVGACSWYDFEWVPPPATSADSRRTWLDYSSDPRCIIFDTDPIDLAANQAKSIAAQVNAAQNRADIEKIVVVTHTCSHEKGLKIIPGDHIWNQLNGAYGNSNMEEVWAADTAEKIIHAVFGHVHRPTDFVDDKTGIRFVANPRGYHEHDGDVSRWHPVQLDTDDRRGIMGSAFGEVET